MKSNFIINELWQLSIAGAFQRAGIYRPEASEEAKNKFKRELKEDLESFIAEQYFKPCTEEQHLKNIEKLSEHTKDYADILKGGQLNIGVSQKVLNLFLKYVWCLKLIPTPPHFPVERSNQIVLNEKAKSLGLSTTPLLPWTQIESIQEYLTVIDLAKRVQQALPDYQQLSLADMELGVMI